MALLLSVPSGLVDAQVALDSPATGQVLSRVVEIYGVPNPAFGAQAAWAINPGTGDDAGPGTPAAPLRTMAEFNRRYANLSVTVSATLQLVGDVIDTALMLSASRFALGAVLAVSGTRTDIGAATIGAVAALGPGGTAPWQLTTAGIDWTTIALGSQLRFSTGEIAMILEAIDANNVVVGALCAPVAGISFGQTTPTIAMTITVAALSRALPPVINACGIYLQSAAQLLLQHLSFDLGSAHSYRGGLFVQLYGCELKFSTTNAPLGGDSSIYLRACRYTMTGSMSHRMGSGDFQTFGCCMAGTGALFLGHARGNNAHTSFAMTGVRMSTSSGVLSIGPGYIQRTAGPILCSAGARIVCNGTISGALGNTSFGVDVPMGTVSYFSSSKPTVTGSTPGVNDTRIGGVTLAYAAIPNVAANTAAMVQE